MEHGLRVTTGDQHQQASGEEVAQLYLEPPHRRRAATRAAWIPALQLKPGERKKISFELSPRDLSFVTRDGLRQVMKGEYRVSVGSGQPGTGVVRQSAAFSMSREVAIPE